MVQIFKFTSARVQRDIRGYWIDLASFPLVFPRSYRRYCFNYTESLEEAAAFFKDSKLVEVYPNVFFPAPASSHPILYRAAMEFCIAFALFQIAILVLKFVLRDSFDRKVETLSGIVFWLGASYLLSMLSAETINWFPFLGGLIIFVGLSLVVRSLLALLH